MSLHRDRLGDLLRERDTLAARLRAADEEIRALREQLDRLREGRDAACGVPAPSAGATAYRITGGLTGDPAASWREVGEAGGGDA
jgi:hypothetical protein